MAFERFSSSASSFWLGSDFDTNFKTNGGVDYTKLAAAQRAIANFVNIVTGKNIPVEFQSNESSYTDGKTVVIGTKLDGADFDPAVGLALHEGSHIVHTDFKTLHRFEATVRLHGVDPDMTMTNSDLMIIKDLLNWIEDRRIDYIIYKWGTDVLINLIKYRGNIKKVLGVGVSEFEEEWYEYVKEKYMGGKIRFLSIKELE